MNTNGSRPMERIAIVVDPHLRGRPPRSRLDDFQAAILRKLTWVVDYCNEQNITCMLIPGDLFDSFAVGVTTIGDLAVTLQRFYGVILTIPGNHDLIAGNPETKWRTPYYMLSRLGVTKDLDRKVYMIDGGAGRKNICVSGHGFTYETDTPEGMKQFDPEAPPCDSAVRIHMVHSMLLAKAPGFDMRHTLIEDVRSDADVIVSGHDHSGFGVIRRKDGKLFINPGSIARLSASETEMNRQVQIAVIDVYPEGEVSARLIPVECAAPAAQVLSREHIELADRRNEELEAFLSILASEGESKFLEISEIIEDIAIRENLPVIVKKEALQRISAAREALGGNG